MRGAYRSGTCSCLVSRLLVLAGVLTSEELDLRSPQHCILGRMRSLPVRYRARIESFVLAGLQTERVVLTEGLLVFLP